MNEPTEHEILNDLIVKRGMSYADAILECERAAREAGQPYRSVAIQLKREIGIDSREPTEAERDYGDSLAVPSSLPAAATSGLSSRAGAK